MNCLKCKKQTGIKKKVECKILATSESKQCNTCGIFIKKAGESYRSCNTCKDFNMCMECKICYRGHYLSRVYHINTLNIGYSNGYNCDLCHKTFKFFSDLGVWHCAPCSFDVCPSCIE